MLKKKSNIKFCPKCISFWDEMCGQAETGGSSRLSAEGDHEEYRFLEYDLE